MGFGVFLSSSAHMRLYVLRNTVPNDYTIDYHQIIDPHNTLSFFDIIQNAASWGVSHGGLTPLSRLSMRRVKDYIRLRPLWGTAASRVTMAVRTG